MRNPLAAWRAGVRWPLLVLSLLAAIVAAVGFCEAIGWPFLVGPVQRRLAATLDRRVSFGDDQGGAEGVRIGLLGSVRVRAARIEIGAPAWSESPHMLLATDARLKLGYLDLWRAYRGEPLHIDTLEAATLDGVIERLADGRASWQFGTRPPKPESESATAIPTFGTLRVGQGSVAVRDAAMPGSLDANFSLNDGSGRVATMPDAPEASDVASAPAPRRSASGIAIRAGGEASSASGVPGGPEPVAPVDTGFRLSAAGHYREFPVRIDLSTAGVLTFFSGADAPAQPLSLAAKVGGDSLRFDGTTQDPLHFTALTGKFELSGVSLAEVGKPFGVVLPTTPPFKTHGSLVKDGNLWKAQFAEATIGSSVLNGDFTFDRRPKIPLLSGRLGGARLRVVDLGPAIGTAGAGQGPDAASAPAAKQHGGRVIPDRKFDLPALRAMDANILIDIASFDASTPIIAPLQPVRAHLLLADGVLTIADFEGVTADGRLVGYLQLDGRGAQALWTADMRMLGFDLVKWLRLKRSGDAPPYLSGRLDAQIKVKGNGRSTAEILGSLDGSMRAHLRDAAVSHLAIEAGGIDVAQALGVFVKGDDALPIRCNVVDLAVEKGVVKPNVFVLNTSDSTVWLDGTVSLKDETLDLRTVVSPKDISPLALRTPIHVRGTLGDPSVSLETSKLAAKAGAAVLLGLLNPLAAIVPFIDTGSKDDAKKADDECAALVPTRGKIAAPVERPAQEHIPAAALVPASTAAATAVAVSPVASASAPKPR